jgi:hypothetical protein
MEYGMEKEYDDLPSYMSEVEDAIKEVVEAYGVNEKIRNQHDLLSNLKLDLAVDTFIPMDKRITAGLVGYEMDLEPSDVSIFISFFFSFHKHDKSSKGLASFFRKKKDSDVNVKLILQKTQNYVLDNKELFETFIHNLEKRIKEKN